MDRVTYDRAPHLDASSEPSDAQPGVPANVAIALAVVLAATAVSAIVWWLYNGPSHSPGQDHNPDQVALFVGWAKPDVALLLSGESLGYLQPCGCSEPQKGGLARRYAFLQSLKK